MCGSRGAKSASPSVCEVGCSLYCLVQELREMLMQSGELWVQKVYMGKSYTCACGQDNVVLEP